MSTGDVRRTNPDPARPGVVGLLILRVWMEGEDASSLRVRLVGCSDLEHAVAETMAAATVDAAVALTRAWIERFPPLAASALPVPSPSSDR